MPKKDSDFLLARFNEGIINVASDWYHLGGKKGAALLLPFIPVARILQSYLNNVNLLAALMLLKMAPHELLKHLVFSRVLQGCSNERKICITADQIMWRSWIMTVIPCIRLQQVPFHHVLLFVSQLLGGREVADYYRQNASSFTSSANLHTLHYQACNRHCPQCSMDCLHFQNRLPNAQNIIHPLHQ